MIDLLQIVENSFGEISQSKQRHSIYAILIMLSTHTKDLYEYIFEPNISYLQYHWVSLHRRASDSAL